MATQTASYVDMGRKLRELRERRGLKREHVALALDMGAENWRHYEAGRTQLTVPMLPTLADLYGMTVAELVSAILIDRATSDKLQSSDTGSDNNHHANYNYTEHRNPVSAGLLTTEYEMGHGLRLRHVAKGRLLAAGVA